MGQKPSDGVLCPVVGQDQLECRRNLLRGCTATNIEKVCRLTAVQLDQIHGRHGKTRAVHHAGNIAVEGNVVEVMLRSFAFRLVFLRLVTQFRDFLLPEQGAAIDVDFAVKRDDVARLGRNQRIDFNQARIRIEVQPVQLLDEVAELAHLLLVEFEAKGQLTCLVVLQPGIRCDRDREYLLRRFRSHFLNIHPASG